MQSHFGYKKGVFGYTFCNRHCFFDTGMIDTVHLAFQGEPERIASRLTDVREHIDTDTGETRVSGKLDNFTVSQAFGQFVIKGSLSKFAIGHNIGRITRGIVEDSIGALSERLGVDLQETDVWRCDVGNTFDVTHPPSKYMACIFGAGRYKRRSYEDETLTLQKANMSLVFYDKQAEARKKRESLKSHPETAFLADANLLRYEMQAQRRVSQTLGKKLTAKDLYNEGIYISLLDRWKDEYFSLKREQSKRIKTGALNVKEIMEELAAIGLRQMGGTSEILGILEGHRKAGELDKTQFHRIKKKLTEITEARGGLLVQDNGVIEELDQKVKQAVEHYR